MQDYLKRKVSGIILCAQGILLEVFSISTLMPMFAQLISETASLKYIDTDSERAFLFLFVFWIIMAIASMIFIAVGKSMVVQALCDEKLDNSRNSVSQAAPTHSGNYYSQTVSNQPHYGTQSAYNEWFCGQCGYKNSHGGSTCINCGSRKQ